ncbi:MAG: hypothetical protein HYZ21_04515 [Chloroflexi bacterium]|nr:hypothetical protein [Chloroflexota bacterium]
MKLVMRKISETVVQKYTSVSRKIFWLGWCLPFVLAGLLAFATLNLESKWSWLTEWRWLLEGINTTLLALSFLSLIISLITAGLLFIFLYPELGAAWLRGINPIAYRTPWDQLSDGVKVYAFFHAMLFLAAGVMVAYLIIINTWYK